MVNRIFEGDLPNLLINMVPSITVPKGHQARKRIQDALCIYYGNGSDLNDDVAGITKQRAASQRKFGVPASYVGVLELALLHVGTSNSVPTFFWLLAILVTRPEVVVRIREEAEAMVGRENGENDLTVNIDLFAEKCPLLVSCYREVIRLANKSISNRRVLEDTTISDGNGRTYLLKKGIDVMMPGTPLHLSDDIWSEDGAPAAEFLADRFLNSEKNKAKRFRTCHSAVVGICALGAILLSLRTWDSWSRSSCNST